MWRHTHWTHVHAIHRFAPQFAFCLPPPPPGDLHLSPLREAEMATKTPHPAAHPPASTGPVRPKAPDVTGLEALLSVLLADVFEPGGTIWLGWVTTAGHAPQLFWGRRDDMSLTTGCGMRRDAKGKWPQGHLSNQCNHPLHTSNPGFRGKGARNTGVVTVKERSSCTETFSHSRYFPEHPTKMVFLATEVRRHPRKESHEAPHATPETPEHPQAGLLSDANAVLL